jgi:hypothetical protein
MKRMLIISVLIGALCGSLAYGENLSPSNDVLRTATAENADSALDNGKALNFPFKKYGISIGNSREFTGLRINYADENVKKIIGLNVTFWVKPAKNQDAVYNGMGIGTVHGGGTTQYINLGLLGVGAADNLNGISIGGLFIGSGGDINGLSIGGLMILTDEDDVVSINGITVAGLAIGTDGDINGVASSLAILSARENRGLAVTAGYLKSEIFKGLAVAGYAKTDQIHGLSIALYNKTKELRGVQFGLLNYAENNPKGLRILPFVNLHL